ncbi:MAG TPA: arginine--tRNA ligase [Anaerolineae bacterium]|nr:arginine--tRNA ligase [Anaerolineae bacterium]
MFTSRYKKLETAIVKVLNNHDIPTLMVKWNWIPFYGHWGVSTSYFQTAAEESRLGKPGSVQERAAEIATLVAQEIELPSGFEKCEAVKGYLNIYFNAAYFTQLVIDSVLLEREKYGSIKKSLELVMVEFSQPNTHKAFHVGHLRNVVIGDAVSNILDFAGNQVIRANYIGDIGLHAVTWLWNYEKYHHGVQPPEKDQICWIGDLYTEAVKRREESSENKEEIKTYFKRWDAKDPEIFSLWKKTRQWSIHAFEQIYDLLDIHFDRVYFESEVEEEGKKLVGEFIKRGLAKDERPEGPVVIYLDELLRTNEEYRVLVLLRSDGTSLYSSKDLSLAIKKFREYELDRSIYVVDVRQSLYLKQIFKALELMGYKWARKCFHLAYEIVNLPGNVTIASREGTVVLMEDLIREAEKRALRIVEEKNPNLDRDQKSIIARTVAIGAIKFSLLSRDNTKVVTFDWETAMNINGKAAPYIQYAAVRANSILRKASFAIPQSEEIGFSLKHEEIELINLISRFPYEVKHAAEELRPLLISQYVYELAKAFNNFYTNCPVLKVDENLRNFRLRLVAASKQTIANSLALLGIQFPEKM